MSEHLETLREVYARWGAGDFHTDAMLDTHAVLVMSPEFPEAGRHVGLEGIAAYMGRFLDAWDRVTIEAKKFSEAGDSVVVAVTQRAVGKESGAAAELEYFQVWTFRGAKAIRLESIRDRQQAFEAAGLPG